jgi:hypothetical protein
MNCKICAAPPDHFAKAKILNKYLIDYYHCPHCGFIQTEAPYWLEEVYMQAINQSDLGLIDRNLKFSTITQALIKTWFNADAQFVDYGGGYGMFVRLMRDAGVDFYRVDKFCDNLFAQGFDANLDSGTGQYELITAFELFEHLVEPMAEIKRLLRSSRSILFSTLLVPSHIPQPQEWWYYGLDHGQHISLFSLESLQYVAKKFHLHLYTNKRSLHLLTEKKIPSPAYFLITSYKAAALINLVLRKKITAGG